MQVEAVKSLDLSTLDILVFAGGGNRCWWQAGVVHHWLNLGWRLPATVIGTSAGAAVATAALLPEGLPRAFDACQRIFGANHRLLDWRVATPHRWHFTHQHVYPAWLSSFLNEDSFDAIRQGRHQLGVALTRPSRVLGTRGSVFAGSLAFFMDRFVRHRLHPRLPSMLGLRQEFVPLHECATSLDAHTLLMAAAASPPVLKLQHVGGLVAMDGGFLDSVPVPRSEGTLSGQTLVLLTRHYPRLPSLFVHEGRHYFQASRPIPVATWDCTARATIGAAHALGHADATDAMRQGVLSLTLPMS